MRDKKLQIIQKDDHFTMQLLENGRLKSVLMTDQTGPKVGHRWWLNPIVFNLAAAMKEWQCNDSQIRQAYESLLSGKNTDLTFDLPD